ncbi:MAG: PaaI family thioesterase [Rhizobiaceae bacterium]|nr:PaaI family thioesterase [Rhizobiaceae bacterium]
MSFELVMDADEVADYVSEVFPQSDNFGFYVTDLSPGLIRVRMPVNESHLRPGGTVSGPSMFGLADCAAYLIILAHVGKVALAVTTNLNINFLSKPDGDLVSEARLLKLGKRLAVCDISIFLEKDHRLVAHATATYSIPPKS